MLKAKEQGKAMVCVTDIAHHKLAGSVSTAGSLDGWIAFSPLVKAGMMTVQEIQVPFMSKTLNTNPKSEESTWLDALKSAKEQLDQKAETLNLEPPTDTPRRTTRQGRRDTLR